MGLGRKPFRIRQTQEQEGPGNEGPTKDQMLSPQFYIVMVNLELYRVVVVVVSMAGEREVGLDDLMYDGAKPLANHRLQVVV